MIFPKAGVGLVCGQTRLGEDGGSKPWLAAPLRLGGMIPLVGMGGGGEGGVHELVDVPGRFFRAGDMCELMDMLLRAEERACRLTGGERGRVGDISIHYLGQSSRRSRLCRRL
jgi:hypothetical protein